MQDDEVRDRLRRLLREQPLGVLATSGAAGPHATLVAFTVTDDLSEIVFATSRATRKFASLRHDPRAALLVDDRSNEVSDFRTGIDLETERTPFSGGSGTLPAGGMGSRTALVFGLVCSGIGLVIGLWFLWKVGWILLPIILAGAVAVLAYTDLLARIGIGEIAAGFGLGAGPVIGAALVQGGGWSNAAAAASIPAFFMTFNLLLLNEFPD